MHVLEPHCARVSGVHGWVSDAPGTFFFRQRTEPRCYFIRVIAFCLITDRNFLWASARENGEMRFMRTLWSNSLICFVGLEVSQQATLYSMKRGETWVRHEDGLHSENTKCAAYNTWSQCPFPRIKHIQCHLYQPAG